MARPLARRWELSRPTLTLILFTFVGHVLLPVMGKSDFWFFSRWELFAEVAPRTDWMDLTTEVDGHRVSFARELAQTMHAAGASTPGIWSALNEQYFAQLTHGEIPEPLRALLRRQFLDKCNCQHTQLVRVHEPLRDYVLLRKESPLSIIGEVE